MSITEITRTVNSLASAWEEFKVINDRRLKEIETKNHSNILDDEQLCNINQEIDECQERLNNIEQAHTRPQLAISPYTAEKKSLLNDYIRCGTSLEHKSSRMNENGFTLTDVFYEQVMKKLYDNSIMRRLASVDTISGDYITFFQSIEEVVADWGDTVKTTDLPSVNPKNIFTHTLHTCPKISQRLLDDAAIDINRWIIESISDAFGKAENTSFFSGTGNNEPKGILQSDIDSVNSTSASSISDTDLIKLYYQLGESYSKNASFIMHRSTVQHIRSMKSKQTGQYIWQPGLYDNPDSLMGVPVYQSAEMPEIAADKIVILFGDFKRGYKIVDRTGINILRDHFSYKPNIAFYATKRLGADAFDTEAVIYLQMHGA